MARETPTVPMLMLVLMLTTASLSPTVVHSEEPAHADVPVQGESVCPDTAAAAAARTAPPPANGTPAGPVDDRVTIEADDKEFSLDVHGNAVVSGNVIMRQGDKVIRADRLEYDAKNGQAKLTGGVEFAAPSLKVRGSSGEYSPALGAQFEGAQFELPQRNARGAARNMQVD